jgi:hypothetical protein
MPAFHASRGGRISDGAAGIRSRGGAAKTSPALADTTAAGQSTPEGADMLHGKKVGDRLEITTRVPEGCT